MNSKYLEQAKAILQKEAQAILSVLIEFVEP